MRTASSFAIAILAAVAIGCGGDGGTRLSHPKLDQDYSGRFAGTWYGSMTVVIAGQTQQTYAYQRIDGNGVNRLAISEMCPGVAGAAGLDTPTSFSIDPLTCRPIQESCGGVTIRYDNGKGTLAQDTLTLALAGNASGCGQSAGFVFTFIGTLQGFPDGGIPDGGFPGGGLPDGGTASADPADYGPSAIVSGDSVGAAVGIPAILDALSAATPARAR